jgi:hypothetical protein
MAHPVIPKAPFVVIAASGADVAEIYADHAEALAAAGVRE